MGLMSCRNQPKQLSSLSKSKPNIIFIMGDDIGYSDIGPYGSEIYTPNLDRLATEGLRFSNFYNMAKCEPSRTTFFTGLIEGDHRAMNFADLLGRQGYYTIHSGKEHFMNWVPQKDFAHSFCDQSLTFHAMSEFFEPPGGKWSNPFILNGKEVGVGEIYHEKEPFFKTDVLTDNALRWMQKPIDDGQPFFLFLGYGAAHYPLQAPQEDIDKYRGKYRVGWDTIRARRFERLKESGLISEWATLSPPSPNINKFRGHPEGDEEIRKLIPLYRPWNSLTDKEKDDLDLEMAVFAAMVDRMDYNIGRILQKLDEEGIADNTIVVFMSDNGSCPYDSNRDFIFPPGDARGFRTLSAAWANAGNTPFRYFKQYGHEGGTTTHCIVRWPRKVAANQITHQVAHIADFFPTFLEITGTEYPSDVDGEASLPLYGHSLLPILNGEKRTEPESFISGFTDRFRMYRKGDWKIVNLNGEDWELYNLHTDPTETNNLAASYPDSILSLVNAYQAEMEEMTSGLSRKAK